MSLKVYILPTLKFIFVRAVLNTEVYQMLIVYTNVLVSTVRPVLEYAVPVWQNIPAYLSEAIERVQKRALNNNLPCGRVIFSCLTVR